MLSTNATDLYIVRFIIGFVAGGSINLTILFVNELADAKYVLRNFEMHTKLLFFFKTEFAVD